MALQPDSDMMSQTQELVVQIVFDGSSFQDFINDHVTQPPKPVDILAALQPGIDDIFRILHCSYPHEPLAGLWSEVEQALKIHIADEERWCSLQYLLLNGSPKFNPSGSRKEAKGKSLYGGLSQGEFRLLVLQPNSDHLARISCDIRHDMLLPDTQYEALSYVWGDPSIVSEIRVGGCAFQATANLEQALRALRYPNEPRVLWVDAICINQRDNDEKSIQIQLMGKIYSLAHRVVVWMGQSTMETELSLSLFEAMIAPLPCNDDTIAREFGHSAKFGVVGPPPIDLHTAAGRKSWWEKWEGGFRLPTNQALHQCLLKFLERPWWTRIWVFQELVLASTAIIVCGKTAIAWDHFHRAIGIIYICCINNLNTEHIHRMSVEGLDAQQQFLVQLADLILPILVMQLHLRKRRSSTKIGLEDLMRATFDYKASDARDKVYALLSIVSNDEMIHEQLIPNYQTTTQEVYRRVAKYLLEQSGEFPSIAEESDAIGSPLRNGVLCWTSWMPDFGFINRNAWPIDRNPFTNILNECTYPYGMMVHKGGSEPELNVYGDAYVPQFNASLHPPCSHPFSFSEDLTCLTVKGFLFDTISITSSTCDRNGNVEHCLEEWQEMILGHHSLDREDPYVRGSTKHEAYWRTVLANRWHELPGSILHTVTDNLVQFGPFPPRTSEEEVSLRQTIARRSNGPNAFVLCAGRKIFRTQSGLFGIGPPSIQEGDVVSVIYGARVPIVLHPVNDGSWRVLGDSYVHGIMHGEVVTEARQEGRYEEREFDLY